MKNACKSNFDKFTLIHFNLPKFQVGTQIPSSIYAAAASAKRSVLAAGRNKSEQLISRSTQDASPAAPTNVNTNRYLRDDFAQAAANWMDYVATNIVTREQQPPSSNLMAQAQTSVVTTHGVLNRCTFTLDCDRAMRKVMQVSGFS